jgi:hypothetical protein
MPRKAAGLTAAKVSKAGPGQYMDGNGLRLFVRDTGARFWIFRYTMAGRTREMGLGRAGAEPGAVPLSEARQKAGDLHRLVRSGTDPLAQRDAEQAAAKAAPNKPQSGGPRSARPPNGSLRATRPAGATPNTAPNGAVRLPHTPIPTWEACRWRTWRPSMFWPPCTRSGQPRPRPQRAYVAGSRRCWTTPAPLDFATGIIPPGGGGICPTRCRRDRRWRPWNIMQRCPGGTWDVHGGAARPARHGCPRLGVCHPDGCQVRGSAGRAVVRNRHTGCALGRPPDTNEGQAGTPRPPYTGCTGDPGGRTWHGCGLATRRTLPCSQADSPARGCPI